MAQSLKRILRKNIGALAQDHPRGVAQENGQSLCLLISAQLYNRFHTNLVPRLALVFNSTFANESWRETWRRSGEVCDDGIPAFVAVLEISPVDSAQKAVEMNIART